MPSVANSYLFLIWFSKVKDVSNINKEISSLGNFYANQVPVVGLFRYIKGLRCTEDKTVCFSSKNPSSHNFYQCGWIVLHLIKYFGSDKFTKGADVQPLRLTNF